VSRSEVVTEKTLSLQLVEMADQVAELERQSSGGADRALGPQDWIAALDRIAELEAAIKHADAVIEQVAAERDAALDSLAVLRVALGAPDDSLEHGTRRR
jgi:hypothetical protein